MIETLSHYQPTDSSEALIFSLSHITLLFSSSDFRHEFDLGTQLVAAVINSLAKAALIELKKRKNKSGKT